MDKLKLQQLQELLTLQDPKSLLLAKKIDSSSIKLNEAIDRLLASIPTLNEPIILDQTARLNTILDELRQPIKIKATLKIK